MKLGIVGLPNVGKSTLFNAITKAGAQSANFPFCTIEPNIGKVVVPDKRVDILEKMYDSEKKNFASIEFVDIAGIVKGASKGEGLGNKFLGNIREVDAIVHVVRCFDDPNVIHVSDKANPEDDIKTINIELILADLETVNKKMVKTEKLAKANDKESIKELNVLKKIKENLENETPVRAIKMTKDEQLIANSFYLITSKPVIYACNINESDINTPENNDYIKIVEKISKNENSSLVYFSAKIEEELSKLDDSEAKAFKNELGIKKSGLDKLITASYYILGLISFLTAGKKEVKAWTVKKGSTAPQAAGKIHTDFEKGFIKAEVIHFDDLYDSGSYSKAKELGKIRLEGKSYIVKDGDVILFRFNV